MALPETALGSVPPGVGAASEQPAGASGTRLKVASRPATVGATWMDLFHPGTPSPPNLEARVRVIADIAGALIQIHDNTGMPRPHRRHGRLTPRHLLVGVDGSASLFTAREPFSKLLPPQPDLGYLAPELLTQSGPSTQQSDVFSLGVLLWEALDNGRLFPHRRAAAISRLIARRSMPGPRIEEEWALPLGDVAMKALAQNPDERYADGTAFWLALREHLPSPDAARQVLSRLAQQALKLELTTDIRDMPPYLAPRIVTIGVSSPPSRSSFDEEPALEAPARYSLHPERSSRHGSPSQVPFDDAAWGLSDPPSPRVSQLGLDAIGTAIAASAAQPSRSPSARARPSEAPRAQRSSAPPASSGPRRSAAPAAQDDSPISTLHVNLPRELIDAGRPYYVSSQPATRVVPWGALSFAALMFFGVGAAVAFGAVTALRSAPTVVRDSAPLASVPAPSAVPVAPVVAAAPLPAPPPADPAAPADPTPVSASEPTPAPAQEAAAPIPAPTASEPDPPKTSAAARPLDVAQKQVRRTRAKPKRPKPEPAVTEEAALPPPPAPVTEPSSEIIREVPEDEPASGEPSGETKPDSPEALPFVDQPY
jgi:hypothetical protein